MAVRAACGGGREDPVLTISSGHSAAYLLDAVAKGRENYYTGASPRASRRAAGTDAAPRRSGCAGSSTTRT